jgi:2-dehydro-3-deoxyphosphogluconate aldolase/(4S)-4-hydroxy-2-oxoglutarate aldolase
VEDDRPAVPDSLKASPVLAILRRFEREAMLRIVAALAESGIATLELTLDSPGLLNYFPDLCAEFPSVRIGIGTVIGAEQARQALDAGASFLVSPHVDERVITAGVERNVPVFPGAATATEVVRAWDAGAAAVKLFPANILTTGTVHALREPLPYIPLIAVGGVDDRNAKEFLEAGTFAVGVGSWLSASGDAVEAARRALAIIAAVRSTQTYNGGAVR